MLKNPFLFLFLASLVNPHGFAATPDTSNAEAWPSQPFYFGIAGGLIRDPAAGIEVGYQGRRASSYLSFFAVDGAGSRSRISLLSVRLREKPGKFFLEFGLGHFSQTITERNGIFGDPRPEERRSGSIQSLNLGQWHRSFRWGWSAGASYKSESDNRWGINFAFRYRFTRR